MLIRDTLEVAYKGVGVASRTPATGLLSPEPAAAIAAALARPALTALRWWHGNYCPAIIAKRSEA